MTGSMTTMRKIMSLAALALFALAGPAPADAQRRVTPVDPTPGTHGKPVKTAEQEAAEQRARLSEQRDAQGNIILVDTVTGQEWVDTTVVKKKTKMMYPRIYCVAAGINIWDPVMRIFGQDYGVASVWGELNMHNRYFPTFELGLGQASLTPEDMNYTYKSPLAPFFKIGANYNVFYNSDPRYKFMVGVRYGFTAFSYRVTDIALSNDYWGTESKFDIPKQNSTVGYFEFVAGVRVGIVKNFSIGWDLRYHTIVHEGKPRYGKPMYIPGYGKRGTSLTGSVSLVYTFELNRPTAPGVIEGGAEGRNTRAPAPITETAEKK